MRTFIDSGVLIAAARGNDAVAARAMAVLDDPERVFVTSDFVRLEVLPKAKYHDNRDEVAFYETFFQNTYRNIPASKRLAARALAEAAILGLSAMDALHVAAAKMARSVELITAEKPEKPLFRATGIVVKTIRPGGF